MSAVNELMLLLFKPIRVMALTQDKSSLEEILLRYYECEIDSFNDVTKIENYLNTIKYDLIILDSKELPDAVIQYVFTVLKRSGNSIPIVVVNVTEAFIKQLLNFTDITLTLLGEPVTYEMIQNLFKLFKIKARKRELVRYCAEQKNKQYCNVALLNSISQVSS